MQKAVTEGGFDLGIAFDGDADRIGAVDGKGRIVWVSSDETFDVRTLPVAAAGQAQAVARASTCAVGIVTPIPTINDGVVRHLQETGDYTFGADVPTVKPGRYGLFVSVGTRDGTPAIALPLENGDGSKRYKIGEIMVNAQR
jgi:hypothetical protein